MDRVVVLGSSGSGKTTVSRQLSATLGVPCLEMDSVYHLPGWTEIDNKTFRRQVSEFVRGDRWVVDGNYTSHGTAEFVWPRVDTVVWLDLPKNVVMRQVIRRTLRRVTTHEELWNGNREPWTNLYALDPAKNIIRWAWTRYAHTREKYERFLGDGTWAHATVHRLSSRPEVHEFLGAAASVTSR